MASIAFDLDAGGALGKSGSYVDLNGAFNWNVKQLFVMVVAEYETEQYKNNQVTIWDKIVNVTAPRIIQFKQGVAENLLIDFDRQIKNKQAKLVVYVDQHPFVGIIKRAKVAETQFQFPAKYQ